MNKSLDKKECVYCGVVKPVAEGFYNNRCATDGKQYVCKDCVSLWNNTPYKEYPSYTAYWIDKNRERHNANNRESYQRRKAVRNTLRRTKYMLNKLFGI